MATCNRFVILSQSGQTGAVPPPSDPLRMADSLGAFLTAMPPRPAAELDPYLDALVRCITRHGVSHASVQDVAKEMGNSRVTVYRRVGTVEQQLRLLFARELHRLVNGLMARPWPSSGPDIAVELIATVIEHIHAHPVSAKILADEMDMAAGLLARNLPWLRDYFLAGAVPLITMGTELGLIAKRDPTAIAEWLFRTIVSFVAIRPVADLRTTLAEVLIPTLSRT